MKLIQSMLVIALALVAAGRAATGSPPPVDTAWLADSSWSDGAAVVSLYHGRIKRYGAWREAEVRDYVIREYLDPEELTKRDAVGPGLIPVLKANRMTSFLTGTYPYRRMASLFFDRRDGSLVKGVGSSQDGCGIAFYRWDRNRRALSYDTYWEGEGAGSRPMPKRGDEFFEEEIPFLAASLKAGATITVYSSLTRNKLGRDGPVRLTVARRGGRTTLAAADGTVWGSFVVDGKGSLESWTITGKQEFSRTVKKRLYYWELTKPGDEKLLR